jgi:methionine-rich copper-binding protein CopC
MLKQHLLVAGVVGVLLVSSVSAHAKLLNTSPADGAQLAEPPKALTLSFAEAVKLASVTVTSGELVVPVTVDRTTKAASSVVVPLPALAPGRYQVRWSAVSTDDGHVSKGLLTFTVEAAKH